MLPDIETSTPFAPFIEFSSSKGLGGGSGSSGMTGRRLRPKHRTVVDNHRVALHRAIGQRANAAIIGQGRGAAGAKRAQMHVALPDTSPANLILLLQILQRLNQIEAILEPFIEADRNCHANPAAAAIEQPREACIEMGISLTADGFIGEHNAARLLNRSATTLRN